MKKLIIVFLFLIPLNLFAPCENVVYIKSSSGINPFIHLSYAVRFIETGTNPDTINEIEQAYGPRQIRQAKLDDFNNSTGKDYTLRDCLREDVSHEVFMWHCSSYRDLEIAAKRWNGSGPKTIDYWNKVKKHLI
jgi:hypothetical protein